MQAAELLALPPGRREMVVRSCHPRRRSLLLDECLWQGQVLRGWDQEAVVAHLELAVRLADAGDSGPLQVRARMQLGNAYRIVERYRDASALFAQAESRLGASSSVGDQLDLELFRVSYALAGDDWRTALSLLRPLVDVVEGRRAARAYLHLARALSHAGELARSNRALGHALRQAEEADEPMLAVIGLSEQVGLLMKMGRIDDSFFLFKKSLPLCHAHFTLAELLKVQRAEAHLLALAGSPAAAARMLWSVVLRILSTPGESVRVAFDSGLDAMTFAVRAGDRAEAVALARALRDAVSQRGVPPRLLRLLDSAERQGATRLLPRLRHESERWRQVSFLGG